MYICFVCTFINKCMFILGNVLFFKEVVHAHGAKFKRNKIVNNEKYRSISYFPVPLSRNETTISEPLSSVSF